MKRILLYLGVILCSVFCTLVKVDALELSSGDYKSYDNKHTITIGSGGNLYDNKYTLTLSKNDKGSRLTGKLGTDKKSVTFYQLNDSKILSGSVISYKEDGITVYLYDYTVYSMDLTPVVDENGAYEVWRDGSKINTYADLQSAVDAATSGDTIKINKDVDATSGAYIKGKDLMIDGNNHTLNGSTWLNSIFVVEEDAKLEVKNLTVDGGATGFEVNYDVVDVFKKSTSIPIVSGSDSTDVKLNISPIVSKGNLLFNNSSVNNSYVNGSGGAVNIVSGEFTALKSKFNHNRAEKGGALYVGSNFHVDQTDYSVKSVLIDNSELSNNYSKNGGAIFVYNTGKFDITNTKVIGNTVTGGKGGAILINNQSSGEYYSMLEKNNLDFTKFTVDNCLFEGNWVGNDGAAIENHEAVLTIKNTIFRKNVGIHYSSSCGTFSYYMDYPYDLKEKLHMTFDNCLFEENIGAASTIADHGSSIKIDVLNTKFKRNMATYNSILLYSSDTIFKNCLFEDEYVSRGVVDIQSYIQEQFEGKPATVTFENVEFKGTKNGSTDILIRKKGADDINLQYTVILKGTNKANIDLWHKNKLIINGEYFGTVNTDATILDENLIVNNKAVINGEVNVNKDKVLVSLIFSDTEEVEGYNWEARKYVYVDEKTYTKKEFFLEHLLSKNGYELRLYTDNTYTTEWDYNVSSANVDEIGSVNIYGRWEEHKHAYDGTVILYENAIYEQCECGYLGKKITLDIPSDLVFDNKEKDIIIKDELGIDDKYELTYFMLNKENKWEEIDGSPKLVGTYKAVLRYNDLELEKEYTIAHAKEENPETGDNIIYTFISLIISISMMILIVKMRKKYI